MKKLFFGILALAIGAFSFVSCDKDDKIDDSGVKVKDYLTLDEQEQLISNALVAATQAFEYSDFTNGIKDAVQGLLGDSVNWKLSYDLMREDSVINARMAILGGDYDEEYESDIMDNLDSLYFAVYLVVKDTIIDDEPYRVAALDSAYYDANGFISVIETLDGHRLTLAGKLDMDSVRRISVTSLNPDSLLDTMFVNLPTYAAVVVAVDSTALFVLGGEAETDFFASVNKVSKGLYISGKDLALQAYTFMDKTFFGAEIGYNAEKKELSLGLGLSYTELPVAKLDVKGVFPYLDLDGKTNYLEPSSLLNLAIQLSDVSAELSLMGGQVKINAGIKSSVIMALAPLMGATPETMEKALESLNNSFDGSIYFKGFSEPQGKIVFAYDENRRDTIGYQGDNNMMGMIYNLTHSGIYVGIEGRDSNGETVIVSIDDYLDEISLKFLHYFMVEDGKDTDPVKLVFKTAEFTKKAVSLINRLRYPYMEYPYKVYPSFEVE